MERLANTFAKTNIFSTSTSAVTTNKDTSTGQIPEKDSPSNFNGGPMASRETTHATTVGGSTNCLDDSILGRTSSTYTQPSLPGHSQMNLLDNDVDSNSIVALNTNPNIEAGSTLHTGSSSDGSACDTLAVNMRNYRRPLTKEERVQRRHAFYACLHCCMTGDYEMLRDIISHNLRVCFSDGYLVAACEIDLNTAGKFVDSTTGQIKYCTPIQTACMFGHDSILVVLLTTPLVKDNGLYTDVVEVVNVDEVPLIELYEKWEKRYKAQQISKKLEGSFSKMQAYFQRSDFQGYENLIIYPTFREAAGRGFVRSADYLLAAGFPLEKTIYQTLEDEIDMDTLILTARSNNSAPKTPKDGDSSPKFDTMNEMKMNASGESTIPPHLTEKRGSSSTVYSSNVSSIGNSAKSEASFRSSTSSQRSAYQRGMIQSQMSGYINGYTTGINTGVSGITQHGVFVGQCGDGDNDIENSTSSSSESNPSQRHMGRLSLGGDIESHIQLLQGELSAFTGSSVSENELVPGTSCNLKNPSRIYSILPARTGAISQCLQNGLGINPQRQSKYKNHHLPGETVSCCYLDASQPLPNGRAHPVLMQSPSPYPDNCVTVPQARYQIDRILEKHKRGSLFARDLIAERFVYQDVTVIKQMVQDHLDR